MITPYFQDETCTLYLGDCLKVMPELEPVNAILTDPDYVGQTVDWFELAKGLTRTLVFTPGTMNAWLYPAPRWVLCWHKPSGKGFSKVGGFTQWEPVLTYGAVHYDTDFFFQVPLNFSTGPERNHPYPKPLNLWLWLMQGIKADGVILDPFVGSGTTLVAAKLLGRKAVGIEQEQKYADICVERLRQSVMVLNG